MTERRDEALEEVTQLTGVPLYSPLSGTEAVPERLKIDLYKLKGFLEDQGLRGHGKYLPIYYIS